VLSGIDIRRLDDVDMDVLTQLIEESVAYVRESNA